MLETLDAIPWSELSHANGSAEDVPDLLRALQTPPDADDDEPPLWQLFGNIYHQGTVYEATAYAVPFLIELVADPQTPERVGILQLLSSIAHDPHADHGHTHNESRSSQQLAREREWVSKARASVAQGLDLFIAMTREGSDISLNAAHVLAQFPERVEVVAPILHSLLERETSNTARAGLLLLLSNLGDRSQATVDAMERGLNANNIPERRAATILAVQLNNGPLPPDVTEAIVEAIKADDLDKAFEGIPWDMAEHLEIEDLAERLDYDTQVAIAAWIVATIEDSTSTTGAVSYLIDFLFPRSSGKRVQADELSELQLRAVCAIAASKNRGRRVFYQHFPTWGLPDTQNEWNNLATACEALLLRRRIS